MSRYIQTLVLVVVLFLAGCSLKEPSVAQVGKKTFENEDYLILVALDEQRAGKHKSAIEIYKILYEKSAKINYIVEAIKLSFIANDIAQTEKLLQIALEKEPKNSELRRIKIGHLMKQGKLREAEKKVLLLIRDEKSSRNLQIAGSIYLQLKSYDLALKYFESAYGLESDESSLLNIIDIQYNYLSKRDAAIALLETHARMQGCEINSCYKLLEIYGKEKNINGIISTYKKLFKRFRDDKYAKKIVELLIYKKDKYAAIEFLEQSGYNQEILLSIHLSLEDFASAYKVAERLYKKTGDIDYLGKMAIYEYESNKDNLTNEILKSVADKFEKVVAKLHDALYLNYYGYLLIDHDIDIEKGIGLVQEALLKEPNSPYYLDSLAWGLYKLGRCKEAKEIMDKLISMTNEEEIMEHSKLIDKCVKEEK